MKKYKKTFCRALCFVLFFLQNFALCNALSIGVSPPSLKIIEEDKYHFFVANNSKRKGGAIPELNYYFNFSIPIKNTQ